MFKLLQACLLIIFLSSCTSFVVAAIDVGSIGAAGEPGAWIRSDAEIFVAHATLDTSVSLFDKATGATLYGPLRLREGTRLVYSRERDYKETFELGQPLPEWCRVVFQPGDFGRLNISFEEVTE